MNKATIQSSPNCTEMLFPYTEAGLTSCGLTSDSLDVGALIGLKIFFENAAGGITIKILQNLRT